MEGGVEQRERRHFAVWSREGAAQLQTSFPATARAGLSENNTHADTDKSLKKNETSSPLCASINVSIFQYQVDMKALLCGFD